MPRRTESSALIDGLLRVILLSGMTATILLAPNAIQLFDKPLQNYLKKLDKREWEREMRKALTYMRSKHLITEDYENGLALTLKARQRLEKLSFDEISITQPRTWDKQWRIVFFDIPEQLKSNRDGFAAKMRELGFRVLQRSVFVHPFPCRDEVAQVAMRYHVRKYVSYIATPNIDNSANLARQFKTIIP